MVMTRRDHDRTADDATGSRSPARMLYLAGGLLFTGLAVIGAILPIVPTTCFLIAALWCYSKSSPRLHRWLYTHPRFGPPLQAWSTHRVIPRRAKILALISMSIGLAVLTVVTGSNWLVTGSIAAVMAVVAGYILTRPSRLETPR